MAHGTLEAQERHPRTTLTAASFLPNGSFLSEHELLVSLSSLSFSLFLSVCVFWGAGKDITGSVLRTHSWL